MTDREPLYRVAWERPGTGVSGRGTRAFPRKTAEAIAAAADKQWPHLRHWIEEVSADE
jgi:hypothetical protein